MTVRSIDLGSHIVGYLHSPVWSAGSPDAPLAHFALTFGETPWRSASEPLQRLSGFAQQQRLQQQDSVALT